MIKKMNLFLSILFLSTSLFARQYCVKVDGAKVYNSAKKNDVKNLALRKNVPLIFTGKKVKDFIEVIDNDDQVFWISTKSVSLRNNCMVLKSKTKLRAGPGKKFKIVKTNKKNLPVLEISQDDGWILVEYEKNKTAWVEIENISRPKSKIRISFEKDN